MRGARIAPAARRDLKEIGSFTIERWGKQQAATYQAELRACCSRVAEHPDLGRACNSIRAGLRRLECGSHVIFYTVDQRGVVVRRILHQRMLPRIEDF